MNYKNLTPRGSATEALLAMLETLRTTQGGAELLARIGRGREVRDALLDLVEKAFFAFTRNAVDHYARTTGTDRITRLKVKLIEQRLAKLTKPSPGKRPTPELGDPAALAQHLVAQLRAAGQIATPKAPDSAALARLERLKPLQQTLSAELDRAVLSNLDNIASLGSIESTLKGTESGELEGWREVLRDAAREIIDECRDLGESLRQAQLCINEIGQYVESPAPAVENSDGLAFNRGDLLRRLEAEIRRAQRYHQPLSLAMLGPNHLDNIKLLIGPQAANEVLRRYLENLTSCARAYDVVTGCNSHRLLWLLPGADPDQGVKALRKAQERLISTHYHYGGRLRPLPSFSAGVVGYTAGEKPMHFLARAEVLAAHAKRVGPSHIEWDRRRAP